MVRDRTTDLNANETSLWDDLIVGLGAFILVVIGITVCLLPIQLLANWLGAGL